MCRRVFYSGSAARHIYNILNVLGREARFLVSTLIAVKIMLNLEARSFSSGYLTSKNGFHCLFLDSCLCLFIRIGGCF